MSRGNLRCLRTPLTEDSSPGPATPHQDHADLTPVTNLLFASTTSLPLFDQSFSGLSWIQDVEGQTFTQEEMQYSEAASGSHEEISADISFELHGCLPSGFPLLEEDAPSGVWAWDMTLRDIVAPPANNDTSPPLLNQNAPGQSEASANADVAPPVVVDVEEFVTLPHPSPTLAEDVSLGPATPRQDHTDLAQITNSLFVSTTSLPFFNQSLSGLSWIQDVDGHTFIQEEMQYSEIADGFYEEGISADGSFKYHAYLPSGFPLLDEDAPSGEPAWDMTLEDIVAPSASDTSLPLFNQNPEGTSQIPNPDGETFNAEEVQHSEAAHGIYEEDAYFFLVAGVLPPSLLLVNEEPPSGQWAWNM